MAETEKECSRAPENKRSRKPAHPVKREINTDMKSFAENTMNELLGWYGYDKVELRDSDDLEIRNYPDGDIRQHISVLKENSLPKTLLPESSASPLHDNNSASTPTSRNSVATETPAHPNSSSSSTTVAKEHGGMPIIVPLIPPPLIKPPAEEDVCNVQIVCAWCQKVGLKRYSLSMGSELKSFCSEKCFAACRRAYFKRNKAREEEASMQHSTETSRLVLKTHSDALVCDWCKHIRHTKEYLDFGSGERRLQFCSAKCLNQYKMDIFYKETQAALPGGLVNPIYPAVDGKIEANPGVQLLTPESWNAPSSEIRPRKAPSPGGALSGAGHSGSASVSPSDSSVTGSAASSSSSTKIPTPRPRDSPTLAPPPLHPPLSAPGIHPPMGVVPNGSPPMVMTPRGPVPLPYFMEHQMMHQIRPPFLRPPGPNSPLPNPMIPGIGPPPPPRTLGPPSSPMHRPMLSPHIHPSSTPTLPGNPHGMRPPHPGAHIPGLPFPPVNVMPPGPIPMPPMMNFGMPSLAPLVPPPMLLVPYPVIVPLPVPIPIPIPIPISPKASGDRSGNADGMLPDVSREHSDSQDSFSPSSSRGEGALKQSSSSSEVVSSGISSQLERHNTSLVKTEKPENKSGSSCLESLKKAPAHGIIDLTTNRLSRQPVVIQRTVPCVQVKLEPDLTPLTGLAISRLGECDVNKSDSGNPSSTEETQRTRDKVRDVKSPLNITLPCADPSFCCATPGLPQLITSSLSVPSSSISITKQAPRSATPCNVIVNGSSNMQSKIRTPPPEQRPLVEASRRTTLSCDKSTEGEDLKENTCSAIDSTRTLSEQAAVPVHNGDEKPQEEEDVASGADHAYALPLMPNPGCIIQPVPKPAEKTTAILPCGLEAPLAGAGAAELEPPLKRRCLRIRNQNK